MQPCFQCFSVCCSSSFPGTLFISPIFPLLLSQTAAQTRFQLWHLKDAWFQPGLAVMLCTIHTQGKPMHSFFYWSHGWMHVCSGGAPVVSTSLFKGSLGVSHSSLQCKAAVTALSQKSCSSLRRNHCNLLWFCWLFSVLLNIHFCMLKSLLHWQLHVFL